MRFHLHPSFVPGVIVSSFLNWGKSRGGRERKEENQSSEGEQNSTKRPWLVGGYSGDLGMKMKRSMRGNRGRDHKSIIRYSGREEKKRGNPREKEVI